MSRVKRWMIGTASLATVGLLAGAFTFGVPLLSIVTAYKAKMLCSEVFVAGRHPADAVTDLVVDDLNVLRIVDAKVDRATQTAVASSLFGAIEREAQFRGDAGCGLVFDAVRKPPVAEAIPRHPGYPSGYVPLAFDNSASATDRRLDAVLDAAFSEPDPARPRRTRAIVVVQDGRVVGERYAPGFGPETPMLGWSMTKSVLNALVGILVKDGRLSLDATARIGAWSSPGDSRGRISLDHLMHMSSGLRFDEEMTSPLTDVTAMLLRAPDMAAFAASQPLEAEPGTRWQYSSGTSIIIARIIRNALGDGDYRRFPRSSLFDPIGMMSAVLETDASGTFVGSSFMYATARDWARFGMLYQQDGVWNGERMLPEDWVEHSRTPAPADPQAAYGAHFWLQIPSQYDAANAMLPRDAFHAVGHEGQFVTIVPSHHAVIVRLGKTRHPQSWDHGAFVSAVLAALSAEERPAE